MTGPAYLPWPVFQDEIAWKTKTIVGPLLRAVVKGRDYAEAGKQFDVHEVLYPMRNAVTALTALANELESKIQEARDEVAGSVFLKHGGPKPSMDRRGSDRDPVPAANYPPGERALSGQLESVA